jgi:hypothetical protein
MPKNHRLPAIASARYNDFDDADGEANEPGRVGTGGGVMLQRRQPREMSFSEALKTLLDDVDRINRVVFDLTETAVKDEFFQVIQRGFVQLEPGYVPPGGYNLLVVNYILPWGPGLEWWLTRTFRRFLTRAGAAAEREGLSTPQTRHTAFFRSEVRSAKGIHAEEYFGAPSELVPRNSYMEFLRQYRKEDGSTPWRLTDRVDAFGRPLDTDIDFIPFDYEELRRLDRDALERDYGPPKRGPLAPPDDTGFRDLTFVSKFLQVGRSSSGVPFCVDYTWKSFDPGVLFYSESRRRWRMVAPDFDAFISLFERYGREE